MRKIRILSGVLLIINGVLHTFEYIGISDEPGSIGILVFGLIYLFIGVLLFNRKLYPVYLGLIIPLTGMTLSIIKFGFPDFISFSALFKLLGFIVIVCCAYIIIKYYRLNTPIQNSSISQSI